MIDKLKELSMKKISIVLACLLLLSGCGNSATQSANDALQAENEALKQQLEAHGIEIPEVPVDNNTAEPITSNEGTEYEAGERAYVQTEDGNYYFSVLSATVLPPIPDARDVVYQITWESDNESFEEYLLITESDLRVVDSNGYVCGLMSAGWEGDFENSYQEVFPGEKCISKCTFVINDPTCEFLYVSVDNRPLKFKVNIDNLNGGNEQQTSTENSDGNLDNGYSESKPEDGTREATDEEVFAAKYLAEYSQYLKNPYSVEIKKVWYYDSKSSSTEGLVMSYLTGERCIYLTIEFTAENDFGAAVFSVIGNTISFDDLTDEVIDSALSSDIFFLENGVNGGYFAEDATTAQENGRQLDVDAVQQLYERYH